MVRSPQTDPWRADLSQQQTLLGVMAKVGECLDLESLFQATTQEVQNLLKTDRVAIYRFIPQSDWQEGEFVAEAVRSPWPSVLGRKIQDHCFTKSYNQGRGNSWVMRDLETLPLQECHRQMLASLNLRANVVVPLLVGKELWGLLTLHQCDAPRDWQADELAFVEHLSLHLGVAIQQAQLIDQQRQQSAILAQNLERSRVTAKIIEKIRSSLHLNALFQTVVEDICATLLVDRAVVVQYLEGPQGEFPKIVAEGVLAGSDVLPLTRVQSKKLDWALAFPYLKSQGQCLSVGDVRQDLGAAAQTQILEALEIRAFLNIALFQDQQFWGVLSLHQRRSPWQWQARDQEFIQKIALHLGIALHQRHLLIQAKNKAASLQTLLVQVQNHKEENLKALQREKALGEVIDRIRQTLDLTSLFEVTVGEIQQLLQADRVAILKFIPENQTRQGEFISEALQHPCIDSLLGDRLLTPLSERLNEHFKKGLILAIDDSQEQINYHSDLFLPPALQGRATLVVPLFKGKKLWGLLCTAQCQTARVWQSAEIEFILKIALNLGVALQQAELLAQTQKRSRELQRALAQVQAQKDNLARIAAEERALGRVINQIRQTLDLSTIFKTTTEEVRYLLGCDRVLVYRFEPDWSGYFIYESVAQMWPPLITTKSFYTKWEDTYLQETQGGRYRYQESWAVDDVEKAGLTECHLAILCNFQVRACIVVPVFVGSQLWGLLGVYQNQAPRQWQKREIQLLEQVANQLGIAVYQAQLLEKTRTQSKDLEGTLADMTAIVDNLADGLLVTDVLGCITRFNPALLAMFGLTDVDLRGTHIGDYFPPALVSLLEEAERNQQPVITAHIALNGGREGQALATSVVKKARSNEEGEQCLGSVVMIRDVTREREIERLKTDFLATVSHELRTPLTSILGFASVIQSKLETVILPHLDPENGKLITTAQKIQKNLLIIVEESERLTALINDVLDIAKMESGVIDWNLQPCAINTIVQRAIASVALLFELKEVALKIDLPPESPLVLGDENRLLQVLLNLLSNALKFTEQGQVICSVQTLREQVLVKVIDSGYGIAPGEEEKIFLPFRQGGEVLTNKPQGTGLGLPICKQIIERHGGEIWVESQLHQGSQFCFTLPLPVDVSPRP